MSARALKVNQKVLDLLQEQAPEKCQALISQLSFMDLVWDLSDAALQSPDYPQPESKRAWQVALPEPQLLSTGFIVSRVRLEKLKSSAQDGQPLICPYSKQPIDLSKVFPVPQVTEESLIRFCQGEAAREKLLQEKQRTPRLPPSESAMAAPEADQANKKFSSLTNANPEEKDEELDIEEANSDLPPPESSDDEGPNPPKVHLAGSTLSNPYNYYEMGPEIGPPEPIDAPKNATMSIQAAGSKIRIHFSGEDLRLLKEMLKLNLPEATRLKKLGGYRAENYSRVWSFANLVKSGGETSPKVEGRLELWIPMNSFSNPLILALIADILAPLASPAQVEADPIPNGNEAKIFDMKTLGAREYVTIIDNIPMTEQQLVRCCLYFIRFTQIYRNSHGIEPTNTDRITIAGDTSHIQPSTQAGLGCFAAPVAGPFQAAAAAASEAPPIQLTAGHAASPISLSIAPGAISTGLTTRGFSGSASLATLSSLTNTAREKRGARDVTGTVPVSK